MWLLVVKSIATGNCRCRLICKTAAKVQILFIKFNKKKLHKHTLSFHWRYSMKKIASMVLFNMEVFIEMFEICKCIFCCFCKNRIKGMLCKCQWFSYLPSKCVQMNKVKCSFAPYATRYQRREDVTAIGLLRVRNVVKVHSHGNNNEDTTISVACVGLMVSHQRKVSSFVVFWRGFFLWNSISVCKLFSTSITFHFTFRFMHPFTPPE